MTNTETHALASNVVDVRLTAAGTVDRRSENPGRPEIFSDKWGIVEGLTIVRDAGNYIPSAPKAPLSRVLTLKLESMGYVESFDIKGEGRGRPKKAYKLTGKAKKYLALSRRWKQPE